MTCTLAFLCIVIITLCSINKQACVCVNSIIYRDFTVETIKCLIAGMNGGMKSVFTDLINTVTARCRYILNVCFTKKEVLVGKNQGDRAITCREGLVQSLYTNILPFFLLDD